MPCLSRGHVFFGGLYNCMRLCLIPMKARFTVKLCQSSFLAKVLWLMQTSSWVYQVCVIYTVHHA